MEITCHENNLPLLSKLLKILGHGYIRHFPNQSAYRLVIYNPQGLLAIVSLVNGYFRTPKIEALYCLILWLNSHTGSNIERLAADISPLSENAWLAGFSDADSNFYIRTTEKAFNPDTGKWSKSRIACRFTIEQRIIEPKSLGLTEPFMLQIANFFGVKLATSTHNSPPREYWYINVSAFANVQLVINYFDIIL